MIWGEARLTAPGRVTVSEPCATREPAASRQAGRRARRGRLFRGPHHHRDRRAAARPAGSRAGRRADMDLCRGDDPEAHSRQRCSSSGPARSASSSHPSTAGSDRRSSWSRCFRRSCRRRTRRSPNSPARNSRGRGLRSGPAPRSRAMSARPTDGSSQRSKAAAPPRRSRADAIIVAAGVQGNVENLGLEDLGVRIERGCIAVDGYGRTNVPGVYAIGDVAGPPMLAHKAEHEGVVCVEAIARASDPSARPAGASRAAPTAGRRSPASA